MDGRGKGRGRGGGKRRGKWEEKGRGTCFKVLGGIDAPLPIPLPIRTAAFRLENFSIYTPAHLPHLCLKPVGGEPLMSETHGQCDAGPTVTFPAYAGTKFILFGDS